MSGGGGLWRQVGELWGKLTSFPQPSISAISFSFLTLLSLLTQPVPDALDCLDQCVAGRGWSDWERSVRREMGRIVLFTAGPSGKGSWRVEEVGYGVGGGVMPQAAQPLLSSVTPSTGTLSPSLFLFSTVSLHTLSLPPSFSFSCSLHAFPSLLSSACRHTLTCCMSPCGNPACHLSIYLKETRFNLLIAEPGIY